MYVRSGNRIAPFKIDPKLRDSILKYNRSQVRQLAGNQLALSMPGRTVTDFVFRFYEVDGDQGDKFYRNFRIALAYTDMPLFVDTAVGYIDYSFSSHSRQMFVGMSHFRGTLGVSFGIYVEPHYRQAFRGLGRTLVSLALLHARREHMKRVTFHDVTQLSFYQQLLPAARVVGLDHEDFGSLRVSDFGEYVVDDSAMTIDEKVKISLEAKIPRAGRIPRLLISRRSEPLVVLK